MLLLILCIGAYLRLFRISEYLTFLGDEGRDALVVKRMLVEKKFTLLGPTASVGGFFLGPIYYYFMMPFLALWRLDPTGPAVMVALSGVATIYLVWRLGSELFSPLTGMIAASLYAFSPLVIAYSRHSWNPNLVPFFATLLIFFLWKWSKDGRLVSAFWAGVVVGVGLQLHYLFLFLVPISLIWAMLNCRGGRRRAQIIGVGLVGFLCGYAPFLAFEIRHNFPNTQSIIRFLLKGEETGWSAKIFQQNISDVVFRLFGRLVLRLPPREQWELKPVWQMISWIVATRLAILTSLLFIIGEMFRFVPTRVFRLLEGRHPQLSQRAFVLLFLWFAVPVVLFGFYQRGIYDYYLGVMFAVPFLAVALILTVLWHIGPTKWLAVAVWIGLVFLNWQGRPFRYPPNNQLAQAKRIAAEALAKTEGKPFNFALITSLNSDHAYRYFFEIWGNPPVTIENETVDPERKTVSGQLIIICETVACKPLGHPLWEIAGFGRAQISGEWDVPFVKIFKLVHYAADQKERI